MDPGERVSREARRIELEQTQEYIREGIQQRIGAVLQRGTFTQVTYDPLNFQYIVSVHYVHQGKKFAVTVLIAEKVVAQETKNLASWKAYLTKTAKHLRERLRAELLKAGVKTVGDIDWMESRQRVFEAGNLRPTDYYKQIGWRDEIDEWNTDGEYDRIRLEGERIKQDLLEVEEKRAIESIKRSLAARSAEEQ